MGHKGTFSLIRKQKAFHIISQYFYTLPHHSSSSTLNNFDFILFSKQNRKYSSATHMCWKWYFVFCYYSLYSTQHVLLLIFLNPNKSPFALFVHVYAMFWCVWLCSVHWMTGFCIVLIILIWEVSISSLVYYFLVLNKFQQQYNLVFFVRNHDRHWVNLPAFLSSSISNVCLKYLLSNSYLCLIVLVISAYLKQSSSKIKVRYTL